MSWLIRALRGCPRHDHLHAERDQHREEQDTAMRAVHMKVEAMKVGAERMESERRRTEAAAAMLARLREDFPR